jgi:hypothetical protein
VLKRQAQHRDKDATRRGGRSGGAGRGAARAAWSDGSWRRQQRAAVAAAAAALLLIGTAVHEGARGAAFAVPTKEIFTRFARRHRKVFLELIDLFFFSTKGCLLVLNPL